MNPHLCRTEDGVTFAAYGQVKVKFDTRNFTGSYWKTN